MDDFVKSGFVAGSLRGMDSSGIAQVSMTKNEYNLHKLPISGSFFIGDRVAGDIIRDANKSDTVTICHTRHSTVGNVNTSSAHPFACGDDNRKLLGVHNGTLTNWRGKTGASRYTVDSEWALNHIFTEKFDAFEDFEGAFCFVWWDSDDRDMLHIARNDQRPMHVVMLESGGMAYASEAGMLYWLLERHDVKMEGSVLELEAGYWYKFPVGNPANFSRTKLPKSKVTSYNSHYRSSGTAYAHETVVQKVQKLFADAVAAVIPDAPKKLSKSSLVDQVEFDTAREMQMLGEAAEFTPYSTWGNNIEGIALISGAEVNAVVRGCKDSNFSFAEIWHCTLIGVDDDGRDLVAILGPPKMKDYVRDTKKVAVN